MSQVRYQPEIDGLRAIAVMSVVLYHAKFPFLSGGYIGVDVFFVISGYLITRLILKDLEREQFSYSDFYIRRARRLFPALFTTLAATFAVAYFLFVPDHFERLSGALISSLIWSSNIYFWLQTSYFDADAYVKPLLHTWSLSVEEQFYLIWPVTIVTWMSYPQLRKYLPLLFLGVGGLSLWWAEYTLLWDSSAAFFLPFSRIVEFAIGAALVWISDHQPRNEVWLDLILTAGLLIILYSVVFFKEDTTFPGIASLVPCIGAAFVIYAGKAKYAGAILRNRVVVGIGLISYSLYLVHWPVIVFLNYRLLTFGWQYRIASVMVSLALATLVYKYVETPFRRPAPGRSLPLSRYGLICVSLSLLLTVPAASAWRNSGWPWRWDISEEVLEMITSREERRRDSFKYVDDPAVNDPAGFAMYHSESGTKLLIIGDSHSKDMFNAVFLNKEKFRDIDVRRLRLDDECLPFFSNQEVKLGGRERIECKLDVDNFLSSPLVSEADWILFSTRWSKLGVASIPGFLAYLKGATDPHIALAGRTAEFVDVPKLAFVKGVGDDFNRVLAEYRNGSIDLLNKDIRRIAADRNIVYLDKYTFICEPNLEICDATDEGGSFILIMDTGH